MCDYSSGIRFLLAFIFSEQVDQARQKHKTIAFNSLKQDLVSDQNRDRSAPSSILLPLRRTPSHQSMPYFENIWQDLRSRSLRFLENDKIGFLTEMVSALPQSLEEIESLHIGVLLMVFKMVSFASIPFTSVAIVKIF